MVAYNLITIIMQSMKGKTFLELKYKEWKNTTKELKHLRSGDVNIHRGLIIVDALFNSISC